MAKYRATSIETVRTEFRDFVLICRSCGDDGFGEDGRQGLQRALKQALRARGQRGRIGILQVECMGVCPKRAVTTGLASRPERLMVIPEGTEAETVLRRLGVPAGDHEDVQGAANG